MFITLKLVLGLFKPTNFELGLMINWIGFNCICVWF